jgi:hypothetical protein
VSWAGLGCWFGLARLVTWVRLDGLG